MFGLPLDDKSTPLKSVLWLIVERVLTIFLSLLVTTSMARHLTPEFFGSLNFLIALVALLAPFMALGLNSLISYEVLTRPINSNMIMGSAVFMRAAVGVIIACIATAIGYCYFSLDDRWLFGVAIFASVLNAAAVIDFWLQAHVLNRYSAILRVVVLALFSGARIWAVWQGAGVAVFVYILAAEYVAFGLFYFLIYHRLSGGIHQLRTSYDECSRLILQSRWLFLSGIAAVFYLKIDQVMLAMMLGDSALGIYVVATKLSEVWYFLPAALVTSFFPYLINKRDTDATGYWVDLQKLNDLLLSMGLVITVAMTLGAQWLVPNLFGVEYADATVVLVVHIWATLFVFMRTLLSKWLIAEELLPLSLLSQGAGVVLNVLLNYYWIPLYGPTGAAYATVISYALAGYFILFVHPDLRPMARIVGRSFALPWRLVRHGRSLYLQ